MPGCGPSSDHPLPRLDYSPAAPDAAGSTGCDSFHRRDVSRIHGDRQDAVIHVCAPFCWLTHIGSGHLDLAECATSAGVAGFHRRDVSRVHGDCQDVFAHGFFSFLLWLSDSERVRWIVAECPVLAGRAGFHGHDVRVVCGDCEDVFGDGCFSFPYRAGVARRLGDSPRSAGVHGLHGRDVRVVCGDCQDVFSHGLSSFLFGLLAAGLARPVC